MNKIKSKKIKNFLCINIGVIALALSFSLLLSPYGLVTGGIGGIVLNILNILDKVFGVTFSPSISPIVEAAIIFAINILLLIFAYFFVGKSFALKTCYCSLMYPIFVALFGKFYNLVNFRTLLPIEPGNIGGYLLLVLFASALSGLGCGIAIKHGASTGGVDIIEQFNYKYFHLPYSTTLLIIDGTTVLIASILEVSIIPILYGLIYLYLSGRLIDLVVFGGFRSYSVTIITTKCDEVKPVLLDTIRRGVTEIDAFGGYTGQKLKMLVCIMNSRQVSIVRAKLESIDPKAFMYMTQTSEVSGIGFTREEH